jgi:hypothetical protein
MARFQPNIARSSWNTYIQFLFDFFSRIHRKKSHQLLIRNGAPPAQIVIDMILSWKSTPDPEHLSLLAALIPFCSGSLQTFARIGKKHPFYSVFSGLSDFKQKKESAQFSVLCGILEIHNTIVITSRPAFAVLIDWIGKVQRSLETALVEDKKRKKKRETDYWWGVF